jgi:hypothetical protein
MKKYSLGALVAAGLLFGGLTAGSASAADFGGNCCADLEERIAELEATTARKGNRKVSLTISGWVAEQVMWWDDGFESNVYVGGIGTTLASNIKFTGQATISPGWSAGYVIHLEVYGSETLGSTNQIQATGDSFYDPGNFNGINTLQSFWFIKSEQLGKVSVGKQSQASDNTALLVDGSGSLVPANYVAFDYAGFFLRGTNGSLATTQTLGGAIGCADCNGIPLNAVRYDSPVYAGFSVSASWGEDDFWDVAARYAGEWADFKVAAAGAYSESTDSGAPFVSGAFVQADNTRFYQVGLYVEHVPTGLFAYGAYGNLDTLDGPGGELTHFWYGKGGLREKWTPLGHTVLYGEYGQFDNNVPFQDATLSSNTANVNCNNVNECTADVELWGFGVVQEIDAAAMSIWLKYRHVSADVQDNFVVTGAVPTEDFQYVGFGALINY